ncbi:hypothetical protein AC138_07500 [Pseudomonas putida]|nr:hypothetical protein AC138_07500 [Pseudomonas putida]KMY35805.1 hypothetical protein AA993_10135 [Pseudomonas putida]
MLMEHPEVATYALADPLKAGCQAIFGLSDAEAWSDEAKEKTIDLWGLSPRQLFQRAGTEWLRDHNADHWLLRADRQLNHKPVEPRPVSATELASPSASIWLGVQAFWGLTEAQTWQDDLRAAEDPFWNITPKEMFAIVDRYLSRDFPSYVSTRSKRAISTPTRPLTNAAGKSIFIIKDIRYENEAAFWRSHNGVIWHITRNNAIKVQSHSSEDGIEFRNGDISIENNDTIEELRKKVESAWSCVRVD